MRKRIIASIGVFALTCLGVLYYFQNKEEIVSREDYQKMIQNHPLQKRLAMSKKERKANGIPPNKYLEHQFLMEMNPTTGKTSPENIKKLIRPIGGAKFALAPGETPNNPWIERGPNNIGGRTRVIWYDPNDPEKDRVFAGGVRGGLWVNENITNPQSAWTQVGISENLAISCYAIDPNNSKIWYVGTGESHVFGQGEGNGVWKTIDGGSTWNQIVEVDSSDDASENFYAVNAVLAWDNNGTTEVFYAADMSFSTGQSFVGETATGWYRSTNGGASFRKITFNNEDGIPYAINDVEVDADNTIWIGTKHNFSRFNNPNRIDRRAGGGKIFSSTNGQNFIERRLVASDAYRVEIEISKQDKNTIYALASKEISGGTYMIKTTNAFQTVRSIAPPVDADENMEGDFTNGQSWYNLTLALDPTNDQIVYVGGIDFFRTTNGGTSWTQISKWSNNNKLAQLNVSEVHADQHTFVFDPRNSNRALLGNDGGVYYATSLSSAANSPNVITSRNVNYNVTQFYSAAIDRFDGKEHLLGGTQDNGSLFVGNATEGVNSYVDLFGGDGAYEFLDKDGEYAIISFVHNFYAKQPLPVASAGNSARTFDRDQESGAFINPADLDDNLDILYTNASTRTRSILRRYSGSNASFTIKRNFTNSKLQGAISAITVSPHTTESSTLFIGTEIGTLLKVTNADTTPVFENIDLRRAVNFGSISDISIGENENELLVTLHNYGINNVYYTNNGGITWSSKEGNLPDIPVKACWINKNNTSEAIIGTSVGVWSTDNLDSFNPTWKRAINGMSNVMVTRFDAYESAPDEYTIVAATYGRGLFTGVIGGDADKDGIPDSQEGRSTNQDTDGDGTPDYLDTDDDGDTVLTSIESGLSESILSIFDDADVATDYPDIDEDGIPDYLDSDDDNDSILTKDEDPSNNGDVTDDDTDQDGIANYKDADDDGDGIPTQNEDVSNNGDVTDDDTDQDGKANYIDSDDDDDGIHTFLEDLNTDTDNNPFTNFLDSNNDGTPDYLDKDLPNDRDQDGIPDHLEDINGDGNLDNDDTDGDGIPNYLDTDDDGDGIPTIDELGDLIKSPNNLDADQDGILDYLDAVSGDVSDRDLSVTLSPDGNFIRISSTFYNAATEVRLYDFEGKELYDNAFNFSGGAVQSISVSNLSTGVYILHFKGVEGEREKKIIIQ